MGPASLNVPLEPAYSFSTFGSSLAFAIATANKIDSAAAPDMTHVAR
jgi:hypothetical protein